MPDAGQVAVGIEMDHRDRPFTVLANHPPKRYVEEIIGSHIPDEIWDFHPWGARILVRRDKADETFGTIYIPPEFRDALQSGTIVKVGPMVGIDGAAQSGILATCPYPDPADLVGLPIIFGQHVGKVLKTSEDKSSDPYRGNWILMTEEDIWGHSNKEPAPTAGEE